MVHGYYPLAHCTMVCEWMISAAIVHPFIFSCIQLEVTYLNFSYIAEHVGYPNALPKAAPATFIDRKLALVVLMWCSTPYVGMAWFLNGCQIKVHKCHVRKVCSRLFASLLSHISCSQVLL